MNYLYMACFLDLFYNAYDFGWDRCLVYFTMKLSFDGFLQISVCGK